MYARHLSHVSHADRRRFGISAGNLFYGLDQVDPHQLPPAVLLMRIPTLSTSFLFQALSLLHERPV